MPASKRIPVTRPDLIDPRTGDRYVLGMASTETGAKRVLNKTGRSVARMVQRTFRGRLVWEPKDERN